MNAMPLSPSRRRQTGGDYGGSQQNALIFSQPETVLSQKACLDQLLNEILESKQDELTMDFQTAVKLLGVILKSGLNVTSRKHFKVLDNVSTKEIIKSLDAIKRLIQLVPEILSTPVDNEESNSIMYEWLLTQLLALFTLNSQPVNTQIGFFMKSMLIATASTSELWKLTNKIYYYLLQICNHNCQFLDMRKSTQNALPGSLNYISLSSIQVIEISLTILQAFFRSISSSQNFSLLYDQAMFHQLSIIATKLWLHLKVIPNDPYQDLTNIHLIFANTCSIALSLTFGRQFWLSQTTQWLFYVNTLDRKDSVSSDVDLTSASLALDLIEYVLNFGTSGIFIKNSILTDFYPKSSWSLSTKHYLSKCLYAFFQILSHNDPSERYSILSSQLSFETPFLSAKAKKICEILQKSQLAQKPSENIDHFLQMQKLFTAPFIHDSISSIDDLRAYVETNFAKLSEIQRIWVVRRIGLSSCLLHGHLNITTLECYKCKKGISSIELRRIPSTVYTNIFLAILRSPNFQDNVLLRLEAIISLRRVLTLVDLDFDIEATNDLGIWLIGCFRSTTRQLRLATTALLPYCITSERRCQDIFNLLSEINFSNDMYLSETVIQAWGQISRVVEGERLNLIFMKLIEILGSENSIRSSFAFYQFQLIARFRNVTCLELMSPFWPTIGVSVVKRHISHPQILSRLTELLEITASDFFSETHKYTVPYMVLTRRKEVLEKIAASLNWSILKLLLENISKTVAVLLMHESSNMGSFVMQSLIEVHESMKNLDLPLIINPNRLEIAFEVLKLHDPEDEGKSQRISLVFAFLEDLLYRKDIKKHSKMQPAEYFFDVNILGIATPFAVAIRGTKSKGSFSEKIQCLKGISKLITCSGNSSAKSVPQICALLQAAMETSELQFHAMTAWLEMLKSMTASDLERVMDLTFSVIIQKWERMTAQAKDQAHCLLEYLFHEKRDILQDIIQKKGVPYLSGLLPDLKDIYDEICILQRPNLSPLSQLTLLLTRGLDENIYIVRQTVQEISEFLLKEQECVKQALASEATQGVISNLLQILLNIPNQFQNSNSDIAYLCAQCVGFLGAIDPSKIGIRADSRRFIVIHNFDNARECIKFVLYFVEHHLLKGFEASTDPYYQSFLAYGIQEYLKFCNLKPYTITISPQKELWEKLSHQSQIMLFPLLSSKYTVSRSTATPDVEYPIFSMNISHFKWLQSFTIDLLGKVKEGESNAFRIFRMCRRIIKDQDPSIFNFVIPYVTLHIVLSGTDMDRNNVLTEILNILYTDPAEFHEDGNRLHSLKQSFGVVFSIIDYFNQSLRARQDFLTSKRKENESEKIKKAQSKSHQLAIPESEKDNNVKLIETFLKKIPAELMAKRSFECKSYSRSLMYWEEHLNKSTSKTSQESEEIYSHFMEIYASIDDPDSLDGIATNFAFLSVPDKILQYENTGKWDYALECYEVLSKTSEWNVDLGFHMLRCIKESGRYEDLLARLDTFSLERSELPSNLLCLGIEAAWLAGEFDKLKLWLNRVPVGHSISNAFEVNIGHAFIALKESNFKELWLRINKARRSVSKILESSPVTSIMQSHEAMVRLHGLADLESIGSLANASDQSADLLTSIDGESVDHRAMSCRLNERLEIVGSNHDSKRYLLALRRSAMKATKLPYSQLEMEFTWIYSARNSRKQMQYPLALRASLQALPSGNYEAFIEYAKLLWVQEDHRGAIKALDRVAPGGIYEYLKSKSRLLSKSKDQEGTGEYENNDEETVDRYLATSAMWQTRWLDMSGQGNSNEIKDRYSLISKVHPKWEKSHYYMAKYYNRIYDSQLLLDPLMRTTESHCGDYIPLIVRSYILSLQFGFKYLYETLPKLITLWLDFSENVTKIDPVYSKTMSAKYIDFRKANLSSINRFLERYSIRVPCYIFYIALPQLYSRLSHADTKVYGVIVQIIVQVTRMYPRQALWFLLGALNSYRKERKERGLEIMRKLVSTPATVTPQVFSQAVPQSDLQSLVNAAVKLATELSNLSSSPAKPLTRVNLRELNFDSSALPCELVMPVGECMRVSLPTQSKAIKYHTAFPRSATITIESIESKVDIMSSLQKPKKVVLIGSNGARYKILCKSKDDVRKDSRLMDLMRSIDSLLKKDEKAYRRRLSINTYWVTPLNEDSGIIEWVDGVRPMRDILNQGYSARGLTVHWQLIQNILNKPDGFKELLQLYKPILRDWFLETFPEPSAWIEARTKYTRTLAVMSMMGFILGLGDRHGENILFDQNSGGIMHVDFDCLFDKGKELEKPEIVPFRLTHNMVDALGVSGYEGGFRRSSEITLEFLRNHEDMVMTMLETFSHDPINDWSKKKRASARKNVRGYRAANTPEEALMSIRNKIRGIEAEEAMPLTVPGQVEFLISQAVDENNLSQMYIGWMPFW